MDNENRFTDILNTIASSSDFNRGFSTGMISTIDTLYSSSLIDKETVEAFVDRDFMFNDINLLRDYILDIIKGEEPDETNTE